jgi:hypothetical protein
LTLKSTLPVGDVHFSSAHLLVFPANLWRVEISEKISSSVPPGILVVKTTSMHNRNDLR